MTLRSALLCLLCLLLALPAGALAASPDIPRDMRVALVSDPGLALYPLRMNDRDMLSMMDLVYESLIKIDSDRRPVPGLATSWAVSGNGTTWTFTLREGVRFHDGSEMTAYDAKATLDAIQSLAQENIPANQRGQYTSVMKLLKSWKVEDRYTLSVTTNKPSYALLYAMTFPVLQSQAIYSENPPGTGPYQISYYRAGEEIWLTAFQGWYGILPHVTEISGLWYDDVEAALRAFEAEDVDIVMTRSQSALRYQGTLSNRINTYSFSTRQLECLLLNNYSRRLRDIELREAIASAINKPRLMTTIYQNNVIATDTIQAPISWLNNPRVDGYAYDPDHARSLLDGLGWTNLNENGYRIRRSDDGTTTELELRLYYYDEADSALRREAANEIANMLREVGIRVRVTPYAFEDGAAKLASGDYDLFVCAYNFDVVPDPSFLLVSKSELEGNYMRYSSKTMNTLCDELMRAYDADEFQQKWYAVQAQMEEDIPFVPLYWRQGTVLTRYAYSNIRDIREYELLRSINEYNR